MKKLPVEAQKIPFIKKKKNQLALTGVAQLVGCCLAKRKVAGSILFQGACLGCGFGPWTGLVREATDP